MDIDDGLETNLSRREIRVLLPHEFRLDHKATQATINICSAMGKDVPSVRSAQDWFNRFQNGKSDLDDLPRSGRPPEVDTDLLQQLIEEDPRLTTRCLAEQLGCSHTVMEKHLIQLGPV
jgi:hypothetical protein